MNRVAMSGCVIGIFLSLAAVQAGSAGLYMVKVLLFAAFFVGAGVVNSRLNEEMARESQLLQIILGVSAVVVLTAAILFLSPLNRTLEISVLEQFLLANAAIACFLPLRTARTIYFASILLTINLILLLHPERILAGFATLLALLAYRFFTTNLEYSIRFKETFRQAWKPADRNALATSLLAAALIFLPFALWAHTFEAVPGYEQTSGNDSPSEAVRPKPLEQVMPEKQPPERSDLPFSLMKYLLIGAFIITALKTYQRFSSTKKSGTVVDEEVEEHLTAQGFVKPLPEEIREHREYPAGARGEILQMYNELLVGYERQLKRSLRQLTPSERAGSLIEVAGDAEAIREMTELFRTARYSSHEPSYEDAGRFRDLKRKLSLGDGGFFFLFSAWKDSYIQFDALK